MTAPCLGELLTALVDGALSHDERDRAHAHLAGCSTCRAEVEAQRALKARMARHAGGTPPPPDRLTAALLGLAVPGVEPAGLPPAGPPAPPTRPAAVRPARPPATATRRRHRRVRRAGAAGSGLLLVGVGVALALGSPTSPASTPVDPASDAFVVDFVSTAVEVPLADPADAAALLSRP